MTKIEWVRGADGSEGMSWNALRAVRIDENGKRRSANHCEHVNEACRFCYADRTNVRLGGLPFKPGHRKDYTFEVDEKKLLEPLRRRKPTRIFVESMSDAFGEWWPDEYIDKLYAVMTLAFWHTFIDLTKRPERRRQYLGNPRTPERILQMVVALAQMFPDAYCDWLGVNAAAHRNHCELVGSGVAGTTPARMLARTLICWPLPNVIEGTSVSCQEEADAFVPILLDTQAALRVVSAEPLLGPINFTQISRRARDNDWTYIDNALTGFRAHKVGGWHGTKLDWVIVGGESGPKARPMHPQWARDIRDQCRTAGVAFFYKQTGEWAPSCYPMPGVIHVAPDGRQLDEPIRDSMSMRRVGKKAAGRLLDGMEYSEFPRAAA